MIFSYTQVLLKMDTTEDFQRTNDLLDRISSMRKNIVDLQSKLQQEQYYILQEKRNLQGSQSQVSNI